MSDREWASSNAGRGAFAALALSLVLTLWTLVGAVRIAPVPERPAPEFAASAALAAPASAPETDVVAAVATDPFAADRSAPAQQYRVPGEEGDEAVPKEAPVLPVVLGTAVSDSTHSFATVQLGEGHSVIVHVGDKIGAYTVKSIERGRVVFTTPARQTLDIPALKP